MRSLKTLAPYRRQDGAVAVLVALMLVVLMAMVALAVDVGGLYLRRRALVNGADAAALAAARTCERGDRTIPNTTQRLDPYLTPEDAADHQVIGNQGIEPAEALDPNITFITQPCGGQYGRVSVQYTSQQQLHFAPVLGFDNHSPVTTAATASWGLGSLNTVPMVLTNLFNSSCPNSIPPTGHPSVGQRCAYWFDDDSLGNGGNFVFLSLAPDGWNVDIDANCNQSGGTNQLTAWIDQSNPTSVSLNFPEPTYVCTDGGLKGQNPNSSQLWHAMQDQIGTTRNFPINYEGMGSPATGAPVQGMHTTQNGNIDKYDIIGFAALKIVDVINTHDAAGQTNTTQEPWPAGNYSFNVQGLTLNATLVKDSIITFTWTGKQGNQSKNGTCTYTAPADMAPRLYQWQELGNGSGCPGSNVTVDGVSSVVITYPVTATTYTDCGPPPPNSSAMCIVTEWRGSTLTGDYQLDQDNITAIRLCDPTLGNCLDQRHGAP
jgi:putative Flp pilus-assembly TadE/G-like protein